jgi:chitosanase
MLTATQKRTAEAIVNIFETSEVRGNYGSVTLIAGDTGHLTFGRSQTTLGSGNLHDLLKQYCDNGGARFAHALSSYLPRFENRDLTLDTDIHLHNVLRATADDPVMRDTQDVFFDERYWVPGAKAAEREGITSPLGVTVVYDSTVHGSWELIRDRTNAAVGAVAARGEREWIARYVDERRAWLGGSSRSDLRATVYRMDAFRRLIELDAWSLSLPLVVRDSEISLATLSATPRGCYDGPQPGTRALSVQTPMLRGLDVRLLQLGLSERGVDIRADGIFGQGCAQRVRDFQVAQRLPATGSADISLIASLLALA